MAGSTVNRLSLVGLVVLLLVGCSSVAVPDVVGEDVGFATGLLKGAGLEVDTVAQEEPDVPPGQVLAQEPMAEVSLSEGDIVRLTIAVSPEYTIKGTFTLFDADGYRGPDDNCYGKGGYDDIKAYLNVTVRGGDGNVLATGQLGRGFHEDLYCEFPILVEGVPKSDFYSVEVGHRGELTYSFDEMEAFDWEVAFKLG